MSKLYEVTVSKVLSKEFVVKADSPEQAQKFALRELKSELDSSDEVESSADVQFDFDTIDEYPMQPAPEVIDATEQS